MKRAALLIAAALVAAALAITASRPRTSTSSTSITAATSMTTTATPAAPPVSRRKVMTQRDRMSAGDRGRIRRTRLLDATLVTAAQAHGVSILTGPARTSDRHPQDMVVTPSGDLTVREIAAAVSRICDALKDPCQRRDYRFLIQTPSGRALLPARLIDPEKD